MAELPAHLGDVRPELFAAPPRVWEKLRAAVHAALAADPQRTSAFTDAIAATVPIAEALDAGSATDEQRATWEFLDEVAFRDVRQRLGLDQCRVGVVMGAPVGADLLAWFHAIGVPLFNGYGLSETTAGVCVHERYAKNGSAGRPFPGIEIRLAADGEILVRGGGVFRGYLDDPAATAAVLDPDGWLHTGDVGTIDADGDLAITDRKKELIITSGGENIAPSALELALERIELIGTARVVGDNRPYITALVALDPDTAPDWARSQGIEYGTLADLTPTMKLKRRGIQSCYATEIEALYH
ncbi:AMP-binding protein [Actinomadura sp. SCN-SB]|uniref:AMP-binding protein n=1 Tax=Actinomadura sp. SCN-SB TaxID=3373092 RepID=UPI003751A732